MAAIVKTERLLHKLIKIHQQMKSEAEKSKLVELVTKLNEEKLYIAFAGHFSAGKSSMINKLLNEQVLPTSPIPTSANLVLLEKGDSKVTLFSTKKERIELESDYSIEQIKEYCKQGEEIEKISIQKRYQNLNENIVIMDTPGIDSTDAAHKLSTESMLHIADVIFYVTDYNHVQSEENFAFIKEMKDRDKLIFLIVNQIDKHNEREVPFQSFKNQIIDSFDQLGLHKEDIFFTTLIDDDNVHNQLHEVKQIIQTIVLERDIYLEKNVQVSTENVIKEHLNRYKEDLNLTDIDKEKLQSTLTSLLNEKNDFKEKLHFEEQKNEKLENEVNYNVSSILKNANIIPYETREKASLYIEARDPLFKVGFLFSKSKTEQERDKRKKDLYTSLKKNIETQITWHFTPLLKEYIQKYEITDQSVLQEVEAFSVELTEQMLEDIVKPGAAFNNQYVLTYSSDISDLVKRQSKKEVIKVFEQLFQIVKSRNEVSINTLKNDLIKRTQHIAKLEQQLSSLNEYDEYETILTTILKIDEDINLSENVDHWLKNHSVYIEQKRGSLKKIASKKYLQEGNKLQEIAKTTTWTYKEQFINETEKIILRLERLTGFKQVTESLQNKVVGYRSRSFTVALFGAFSAGKSSFANALIGDRLLPSSPTPTTATINKIAPPTNENVHGSVEVRLKKKEVLLEEILASISLLANDIQTIEEAYTILATLKSENSFEQDMIKKYKAALEEYQHLIKDGLVLTTSIDYFKDYVSKEEKACLVEEVIIYYDCGITRAGITLVDTPGADSLHKRHTDVAFQYIKNADVILYVTYYNHPFSKGDREFLRQLGRVKDSFTLDKMFFIINAIDLAKDEQEVSLVKEYIQEQLLLQEIRNVRLYGISSMSVLNDDMENKDDFYLFQEQFDTFIKHDLTNTAIGSIYEDLKRLNDRLRSLIEVGEKDEAEKENTRAKHLQERKNIKQELSSLTTTHLTKSVNRELKELLYYVKQRIFLRITDFFKDAFHPGAFTQHTNTQNILMSSLEDLIKTIEFELVQELQATSLRIENYIQKVIEQEFSRLSQVINKHTQAIYLTKPSRIEMKSPRIKADQAEDWIGVVKPSLKLFKNPKSFFEKNEKQKMIEDLQKRLEAPFSETLLTNEQSLFSYYIEIVDYEMSNLLKIIDHQLNEGFEALLDVYSADIELLRNEQIYLEKVINSCMIQS